MVAWFRIAEGSLRRTAHVVEQMAPGGIERDDPGRADRTDLQRARERVRADLVRAGSDPDRREAIERSVRSIDRLGAAFDDHRADVAIYLEAAEHELPIKFRRAAIEIDFAFGDRDGRVSLRDLAAARQRYAAVRGPVGWNRTLTTDEVERRLYPARVLQTSTGARLHPSDWLARGPRPLVRLEEVVPRLDDGTLARTYADVAARFATANFAAERVLFDAALNVLAQQIRARRSVRPTISDIARIGCEDPRVKAVLHSPLEMARFLRPELLERVAGP